MSPAAAQLRAVRGNDRHARQIPGVRIAVVAVTFLAVYDLLAGPDIVLVGLLSVGPCLAAVSAGWRGVAGVGGYSALMLLILSGPDQIWGTRHQLLYLVALVLITATSALVAHRRQLDERRLTLAQAQFADAFDGAAIGLALVRAQPGDDVGGLGLDSAHVDPTNAPSITVNAALRRMCRWDEGEPPYPLLDLLSDAEDEAPDRTIVLADGSVLTVVVTRTDLPVPLNDPALRLVQVEDVTLERHEHEVLTRLALYDQLTGLASRVLLRDRLAHALQQAHRRAVHVALLYLDLDGFKHTNDSLGHDAGDSLLVEVARRLETAVRPEDTVARFGGDEFVVLLDEIDRAAEAEAVADRIQEVIAVPVLLDGHVVYPSASIGVAVAAGSHTSPDAMLRDADTAMYQAKGRGRSRYELFSDHMRLDAIERLAVESGLHQALDRAELRVHLQPIVDPVLGRVLGAEALVRWERPGLGLVAPASFVPVAEDCGLIGRIDEWVLGEAIAQATRYRRERSDPDFYVSVNLSATELAHSRLADTVSAQLTTHGLPAENLVVEVTESVYAEAVGSTLTSLQSLREMRLRLALDDFGTGYSSLTYIKRYPFDILKIDQSFVRGMLTDRQDAGIVSGVLALARGLGLDAVAEGVESPGLAERVGDLGCPMAQGFTWAHPQSLDDLIALPDRLVAT